MPTATMEIKKEQRAENRQSPLAFSGSFLPTAQPTMMEVPCPKDMENRYT